MMQFELPETPAEYHVTAVKHRVQQKKDLDLKAIFNQKNIIIQQIYQSIIESIDKLSFPFTIIVNPDPLLTKDMVDLVVNKFLNIGYHTSVIHFYTTENGYTYRINIDLPQI